MSVDVVQNLTQSCWDRFFNCLTAVGKRDALLYRALWFPRNQKIRHHRSNGTCRRYILPLKLGNSHFNDICPLCCNLRQIFCYIFVEYFDQYFWDEAFVILTLNIFFRSICALICLLFWQYIVKHFIIQGSRWHRGGWWWLSAFQCFTQQRTRKQGENN